MFERLKRNNRDLSLARQEECFFSCMTDCHVARQSVLDRPVPRCGALEIWLAMRLDGVGIPACTGANNFSSIAGGRRAANVP